MKRYCYSCHLPMTAEAVVESICWIDWFTEYPEGWEGEGRCMPDPNEVIQEDDEELEKLCKARKTDYFQPGGIFFCTTCVKNQFEHSTGVKIPEEAHPHKHFWGVF